MSDPWSYYKPPPECPKCGIRVDEHTDEQCRRWSLEKIVAERDMWKAKCEALLAMQGRTK